MTFDRATRTCNVARKTCAHAQMVVPRWGYHLQARFGPSAENAWSPADSGHSSASASPGGRNSHLSSIMGCRCTTHY